MRPSRLISLLLATTLAVSGCASYRAGAAVVPNADGMPMRASAGGLSVGADPYVSKDRIKSVFDGDLLGEGVLAIQVLVHNKGERRVLVRPADMTLALPSGTHIGSAGATAVAARFEQGVGDVVGWGIAFGVIGMLAASANKDQVRTARLADYRSKELADVTLGQGDSAHGFVFFIPPQGTSAFSEATLTVHFVDVADGSREIVPLPLRRLDFKPDEKEPKPERALASGAPPSPAREGAAGASMPVETTATSASPDAARLVGTWTGTLRANGLGVFSSMINYAATFRVRNDGGQLRWSLEMPGGDHDGTGEIRPSQDGLELIGSHGQRAVSVSYSVTALTRSTLQAAGTGSDNRTYLLNLTKQR